MSDWGYHGRTTDVQPRSAYEALIKIGQLVDESEGEIASVELGQIYNAIKNGAESEMDDKLRTKLGLGDEQGDKKNGSAADGDGEDEDENKAVKIFRQLVRQYEDDHIHFLIDKGHVFDEGSGDGHRKIRLSNQGRSVVDYDQNDKTGRARRLFIESLESTQGNTFRYGAITQNKAAQGIRPLAHLARALKESGQDELHVIQAAEALFDSTNPGEAASTIKSLSDYSDDELQADYEDHDQLSDAEALFAEAVNHPAFYWTGSGDNRTLHVRDETALDQLTDQHDGITPEQYQALEREVGRTIQGQPGLRMADLMHIRGIGPKTERSFYQALADRCSNIRVDDPDERRRAVGEAIEKAIQNDLPSNVDTASVHDAVNIQEHDYEKLYRGELQAMRQSVEYVLGNADEVKPKQKISIVEGVFDDESDLLSNNIDYFCGQVDEPTHEPPSPKKGYETLLGCEGFSRRLYYERARQGAANEEIKNVLDYLHGHYNSDQGVEDNLPQVHEKTRYPVPDREKALVLEDFFGLSLMAMADKGHEVNRNLRTTRTPFGVHGSSVAPGENPDTSAIIELAKHFTGEITGLNNARELYERELEAILRHAENYAENHGLDPESVPVLFVAANGLDADSSALDGLARAYQSNSTFSTNPVPLNLLSYRHIFEAVQENDTSLDELYDFLQQVGKTFKFYAKYDYSIEDWAERARSQIVDHIKDDGTISTDRTIRVDLPTTRHSDEQTRYCTIRTNELPNMTYDYMLDQYRERLDAELSYYVQKNNTPKDILQDLAWDSNVETVRDRFGDVDMTPAGYKLLLDEHDDELDEAIKRKNRRRREEAEEGNVEEEEGHESSKRREKEHKALETIEGLLSNCSDDVLRGGDFDFWIDLNFWKDHIERCIEGKAELNDAERSIVEAIAQKEEGFAEWVSGLETNEQQRAGLHVLFASKSVDLLKENIESGQLDMVQQILQSDSIRNYSNTQEQLGISKRATYKKWQEVEYWRQNFPEMYEEHVRSIINGEDAVGYDQFLWNMSEVLKNKITTDIQKTLNELVYEYDDREQVYSELKERFEDERLQQLTRQAGAIMSRPVDFNSDTEGQFKERLKKLVDVMADEAQRSFDLHDLRTDELRSYYEQLRDEFKENTDKQTKSDHSK